MNVCFNENTIAAIATATGNSGIGIIRISGDEAFTIIDKIFRKVNGEPANLSEAPSHTVHYGMICDGDEKLDEVLVLIMRCPHSYTSEHTVEIDCHGGALVMKKILETVIKYGASPAQPGEFTKRAYMNGRVDLSQAEAVMDVIQAKNQNALKCSVSQLRGSVSEKINQLRQEILHHIAYIESALDDPEHISLDGYGEELQKAVDEEKFVINRLLSSSDDGRVMTEGVKTVILGKPNVGKSSLMNLLLGEDRAIVTDIAGTTRDTLEEHIYLQGISLNIVDTAGIRDTQDVVEKIGVEKARNAADDADLLIYVVDASCPLDENDREILDYIKGRRAVVLLNKTDLDLVVTERELEQEAGCGVISISAKEGTGIGLLEEKIKSMFYMGELDFNDQVYITNVRHKAALSAALSSLEMVGESVQKGMPEDFYSIDLMDAYEQLGLITGESVGDDLVNEIFSKFCMGK